MVDKLNSAKGEYNYYEEYIAWLDGYIGIRNDYTEQEYKAYKQCIQKLIFSEPLLFLKTRVGMWMHTNDNFFEIDFYVENEKISDFITEIFGNLNIPIVVLGVVVIISLFKKNWLTFLLLGAIVGHSTITLLLAPCAYFKYYYQMYLVGWFILFLIGINSSMRISKKTV